MKEMLVHERKGIDLYRHLLEMVAGSEISLEELARQKIRNEEVHGPWPARVQNTQSLVVQGQIARWVSGKHKVIMEIPVYFGDVRTYRREQRSAVTGGLLD